MFNLIEDAWIPVGERDVSIREALVCAHELPGWPGGDFGFAEALLRLLVPIVYRVTNMDDEMSDHDFAERQRKLLKEGRFDESRVEDYLAAHFDRFWLTGGPPGVTPFAQDLRLEAVEPHKAAKAVSSWATGNNPLLGPHTRDIELSPEIAAQRLLVLRLYAWGGRCTKHPDLPNKGAYDGAPLRGTMSAHPVGENLAETLVAHLVPLPGGDTKFGKAFWEQPASLANCLDAPSKRAGLLEQITGRQDKTMLWRLDPNGSIAGFTIAAGQGVHKLLFCEDPYILCGLDKEPRKPKQNKAFWRESEALIAPPDSGAREMNSLLLQWATGENSNSYREKRFSWAVVSHLGDKSKDMIWTRHMAPHLLRLFDRSPAQTARSFLTLANSAEETMVKQIAKLWHSTGQMPGKAEGKAAVYAPARAEFWKLAEGDFWEAVTGAATVVSDGDMRKRLRRHALTAFDRTVEHLTRNARTHLSVVDCRRWIEKWERQRESQPHDHEETA